MYPGTHAATTPDKPALIMADTGETLTYRELEDRSVRLAHVLYDHGLRPGDSFALLSENSLRYHEAYWAALRSGLYVTALNHHLAVDELTYILNGLRRASVHRVGRQGRRRRPARRAATRDRGPVGLRRRRRRL